MNPLAASVTDTARRRRFVRDQERRGKAVVTRIDTSQSPDLYFLGNGLRLPCLASGVAVGDLVVYEGGRAGYIIGKPVDT